MAGLLELVLLLKKSPMFQAVDTQDLRLVARAVEEQEFFAGDRVFDINHRGDCMYIIVSGKVGISIDPDPHKKQFIAEISTGECLGEMGMLDNLPRSATAHVLEDTRMLTLEKARLHGLIVRYPELAMGLLRGMSHRLRAANAWAVTK